MIDDQTWDAMSGAKKKERALRAAKRGKNKASAAETSADEENNFQKVLKAAKKAKAAKAKALKKQQAIIAENEKAMAARMAMVSSGTDTVEAAIDETATEMNKLRIIPEKNDTDSMDGDDDLDDNKDKELETEQSGSESGDEFENVLDGVDLDRGLPLKRQPPAQELARIERLKKGNLVGRDALCIGSSSDDPDDPGAYSDDLEIERGHYDNLWHWISYLPESVDAEDKMVSKMDKMEARLIRLGMRADKIKSIMTPLWHKFMAHQKKYRQWFKKQRQESRQREAVKRQKQRDIEKAERRERKKRLKARAAANKASSVSKHSQSKPAPTGTKKRRRKADSDDELAPPRKAQKSGVSLRRADKLPDCLSAISTKVVGKKPSV